MKKIINLNIFLCLLSFSACTPLPVPTLEIESQPIITDDNATITFYHKRLLQSSRVYQINEENNVNLIDIMNSFRDIKHIVPAGKYVYVVRGERYNFMEASLEAGKNYYVRINTHFGFFLPNYSFTPITEEEYLKVKRKNTYITNPTITSKIGTKKIIKKYNKWLKLDESKKTYLTN